MFFRKLHDDRGNYDSHCKWAKNIDLFEKDFIFFPCNDSLHWSLMCVVRPGLCIEHALNDIQLPPKLPRKKLKPIEIVDEMFKDTSDKFRSPEAECEINETTPRNNQSDMNFPCIFMMDSLTLHSFSKFSGHIQR